MNSPDGPQQDTAADLALSVLHIKKAGLNTRIPLRPERFARATADMPMDEVATSALMVATHLALAHFSADITAQLHEILIHVEAQLGTQHFTEPVHVATTILDGYLNGDDELIAAMNEAHPLQERARGLAILAGLMSRFVARSKGVSADDVIDDLIAAAPRTGTSDD